MLPGILELLTFGSAIFLMVFAATNYLAFLIAESKIEKVIGLLSCAACSAALVTLFVEVSLHDRTTLLLIVICVSIISIGRYIFVKNKHKVISL